MATDVRSREALQAFRNELIAHAAEGLPVEHELEIVERSLLRATVQVEVPCKCCNGTGWEHITHRVRNRYVDSAVRCTDCDGRGQVAAR